MKQIIDYIALICNDTIVEIGEIDVSIGNEFMSNDIMYIHYIGKIDLYKEIIPDGLKKLIEKKMNMLILEYFHVLILLTMK
jgi:hypothetical protein